MNCPLPDGAVLTGEPPAAHLAAGRLSLATRPLPEMKPFTRWACRRVLRWLGKQILSIEGAEQVATPRDPFILVLNHSQRREAILIPALLAALRGGRQVHFMADWNFLLMPVVATLIRMNDPIIVNRKPARPPFLNVFRPLLTRRQTVPEQARERLRAGRSIGIFPEGAVNRDPRRLLRGLTGAAQLSLELALPVVPAGIRFPELSAGELVAESARLAVRFGTPLHPDPGLAPRPEVVRKWHAQIMQAIAQLSAKEWSPTHSRTKYAPGS